MCKYFRISNYRPGHTIALEGMEREEVVFILSGEVSVVVDVPDAPTPARKMKTGRKTDVPVLMFQSRVPELKRTKE